MQQQTTQQYNYNTQLKNLPIVVYTYTLLPTWSRKLGVQSTLYRRGDYITQMQMLSGVGDWFQGGAGGAVEHSRDYGIVLWLAPNFLPQRNKVRQ